MFQEVNQKSATEEVRAQFLRLLAEGELAPGDNLPGEKELIAKLGVSRPALREALHRMIGDWLLEVRPGRGSFVTLSTQQMIVTNGASLTSGMGLPYAVGDQTTTRRKPHDHARLYPRIVLPVVAANLVRPSFASDGTPNTIS